MTILELAKELSKMYENAPENKKATMIHLFGVRYGKIIRDNEYSVPEIVRNTKLKSGLKMDKWCATELNKGVNLAEYVVEKIK